MFRTRSAWLAFATTAFLLSTRSITSQVKRNITIILCSCVPANVTAWRNWTERIAERIPIGSAFFGPPLISEQTVALYGNYKGEHADKIASAHGTTSVYVNFGFGRPLPETADAQIKLIRTIYGANAVWLMPARGNWWGCSECTG